MAEFPEPIFGIQAAIQIQRRIRLFNESHEAHERLQMRISIHTGLAFGRDDDIQSDVVSVAARMAKRSGPVPKFSVQSSTVPTMQGNGNGEDTGGVGWWG
jgi:class 3 adenylate cyclase